MKRNRSEKWGVSCKECSAWQNHRTIAWQVTIDALVALKTAVDSHSALSLHD